VKSAFQSFVSYLLCDWIASLGAVVTTTSAVIFLTFAFQSFSNPYYGIIVFLVFPAFFVLGLALIPVGIWRCSRRRGGIQKIPRVDVGGPAAIRFLALLALLTVINVAIVSAGTYSSVQYMDSQQFCGTVCHTVMTPQYAAYQNSSHSHVECVNCHVGPGAAWFVHYKVSGVRQLVDFTLKRYSRPVHARSGDLRPAEDTCARCHWPEKFQGEKLKLIRRYDDDERSTEKVTVLMMHVGTKIHKAHVGKNIEYIAADSARQDIPWVSANGVVFKTRDVNGERRKMDCIDCHNRPTHAFDMPAPAVDAALESGELDRSIPFAKRDAVLALTGKKPIEQAPPAVKRIYARNVFPEMMVAWGAYPNNLGHDSFPGCFRCHDESHKNDSGKAITQDCSTCHEAIALSEQNPEILKQLGLK
jgi:hypothetical protein